MTLGMYEAFALLNMLLLWVFSPPTSTNVNNFVIKFKEFLYIMSSNMFQEKKKGGHYFADDFDFGETFEEYHVDPWEDVQKYLKKKKLSCTDQKIAQVRDENKEKVSFVSTY